MKFTQAVLPILFSSAVLASPTNVLEARATSICGQWDTVPTGAYTVYQDLWGKDSATSGSQCTTVNSLSGDTISWSTSWSWAGASSSVKSFANVGLTKTGNQLSAVSSIPTVWKWSYTGNSIVADVAYDFFTSSSASGSNEFEIMIWLAALGGAGPISSTGSPVATPTINGVSWKLYSGPNGSTTVYSFVATSQQTNFSGDLKLFFDYLVANQKFKTSQYITTIQAGTEPFTGSSAVFTVSAYSVSIATGGSPTTTSKATTTTATTAKPTTAVPTTSASAGGSIAKWGQCGGIGWTGTGTCVAGTTCTVGNAYYSQCL